MVEPNYECNNPQTWKYTLDQSDIQFKFYDESIKEEKDVKKIKDEMIFPNQNNLQRIKKFSSKQKNIKDLTSLEVDLPVFVKSQAQYAIIRKVLKDEETADDQKTKYEVRMQNSLENLIVDQTDIQRSANILLRIHSIKAQKGQTISIQISIDATIQTLMVYVGAICRVPQNFITLFFQKKKLSNSDQVYRLNIVDGSKLFCLQGQGEINEFKRFKAISSGGWCYSATSWDAITFKSNRSVMVAGFGAYGLTSGEASYHCRYKIIVGSENSEEHEITILQTDVDPKTSIIKIMFPGEMIDLQPGTQLTVAMRMVSLQGNTNKLRGYYGNGGTNYKTLDNTHKDLFELNTSSLSNNGTGLDSGQIPTIYYYTTS